MTEGFKTTDEIVDALEKLRHLKLFSRVPKYKQELLKLNDEFLERLKNTEKAIVMDLPTSTKTQLMKMYPIKRLRRFYP